MATKTNTEIFSILGECRRLRLEGVTQKQFAQDRGLSVRTLRDWQRRFQPKEPSPTELIARAQVMVDELQRMIDNVRSAPKTGSPGWQRWLLDAAYR
jgi:DNA-binding transcriptional regulator YiaG